MPGGRKLAAATLLGYIYGKPGFSYAVHNRGYRDGQIASLELCDRILVQTRSSWTALGDILQGRQPVEAAMEQAQARRPSAANAGISRGLRVASVSCCLACHHRRSIHSCNSNSPISDSLRFRARWRRRASDLGRCDRNRPPPPHSDRVPGSRPPPPSAPPYIAAPQCPPDDDLRSAAPGFITRFITAHRALLVSLKTYPWV